MIIDAYELQLRLDRINSRVTLDQLKNAFTKGPVDQVASQQNKKREEYFVKPIVFNYNKFLQECQLTSDLCSITQKKIRNSERAQAIANRALANIRGEPYHHEDIDRD